MNAVFEGWWYVDYERGVLHLRNLFTGVPRLRWIEALLHAESGTSHGIMKRHHVAGEILPRPSLKHRWKDHRL